MCRICTDEILYLALDVHSRKLGIASREWKKLCDTKKVLETHIMTCSRNSQAAIADLKKDEEVISGTMTAALASYS
jgi:hypothetical protein